MQEYPSFEICHLAGFLQMTVLWKKPQKQQFYSDLSVVKKLSPV